MLYQGVIENVDSLWEVGAIGGRVRRGWERVVGSSFDGMAGL